MGILVGLAIGLLLWWIIHCFLTPCDYETDTEFDDMVEQGIFWRKPEPRRVQELRALEEKWRRRR